MNKSSSLLSSVIGILMTIGILFGEIAGLIHSFKKHGTRDGFISVFIPPYAIYRGYEMFWHDDFAKVNWEDRYKADLEIFSNISSGAIEAKTPEQVKEIQGFYREINKYPEANKQELKKRVDALMEYYFDLLNSVETHCISFLSGDNTKDYELPLLLLKKEAQLKTYGVPDEWLQLNRNAMKETIREFERGLIRKQVEVISVSDIEDYRMQIKSGMAMQKSKSKIVYSEMFQSEYSENKSL